MVHTHIAIEVVSNVFYVLHRCRVYNGDNSHQQIVVNASLITRDK